MEVGLEIVEVIVMGVIFYFSFCGVGVVSLGDYELRFFLLER